MTSKSYTQDQVDLGEMRLDINYIKSDVKEIKNKLEQDYVTRDEFDPIKKIVYGMVSMILMGVVGALISLVILQ